MGRAGTEPWQVKPLSVTLASHMGSAGLSPGYFCFLSSFLVWVWGGSGQRPQVLSPLPAHVGDPGGGAGSWLQPGTVRGVAAICGNVPADGTFSVSLSHSLPVLFQITKYF